MNEQRPQSLGFLAHSFWLFYLIKMSETRNNSKLGLGHGSPLRKPLVPLRSPSEQLGIAPPSLLELSGAEEREEALFGEDVSCHTDDSDKEYLRGLESVAGFANVTLDSLQRTLEGMEALDNELIYTPCTDPYILNDGLFKCRYNRILEFLAKPTYEGILSEIPEKLKVLTLDDISPSNKMYNKDGVSDKSEKLGRFYTVLKPKIPGICTISLDSPVEEYLTDKRIDEMVPEDNLDFKDMFSLVRSSWLSYHESLEWQALDNEFIHFPNLDTVIDELQVIAARSGVISNHRWDWIKNSETMWSETSTQSIVEVPTGIYYLTNTGPWRIPPLDCGFWLLLAAMTYEFPELSADELSVVDRYPIFYKLLQRRSASALAHLDWFVNNLDMSVEDIKTVSPSVNKRVYDDDSYTYFKYHSKVVSHVKWQAYLGAILVLFFLPDAEAYEIKTRNGNFMVGFIIFVFTFFQTMYTLYSNRRAIQDKVKKVFDIEEGELKSELDKAFAKAKLFRAEGFFSNSDDRIFGAFQHLGGLLAKQVCTVLFKNKREWRCWTKPVRDKLMRLAAHGMFAMIVFASRKHKRAQRLVITSWAFFTGISFLTDDIDEAELCGMRLTAESVDDVDAVFGKYKSLKHSHYGTVVGRLLERAVYSELDLPHKETLKFAWKNANIMEDVTSFLVMSSRAVVLAAQGCPISEILETFTGVNSDLEWIACKRIADLIPSGLAVTEGYSLQYMYGRFTALKKDQELKLKRCPDWQKHVYIGRLININSWIDDLTAKHMGGSPKMQPFVVTLYGPAGCGKSFSIDALQKMLHKVYVLETGDNITPKVDNYSCEDKYDSNLDCATTCIVMDDIGVIKSEKRETTVMADLKRMCGSIVEPFVKADLDSKGKAFNLAKFVIITTNAFDGGVSVEATDPVAGHRRLGFKVHVTPKAEVINANGDVVLERMYSEPGLVSGHCDYMPYEIRMGAKGSPGMVKKYAHPKSDKEIMQLIRTELIKHIARHSKVKNLEDPIYCGTCGVPLGACECKAVLEQLGVRPPDPAYSDCLIPESGLFVDAKEKAKRHLQFYGLCALNSATNGSLFAKQRMITSWWAMTVIHVCYVSTMVMMAKSVRLVEKGSKYTTMGGPIIIEEFSKVYWDISLLVGMTVCTWLYFSVIYYLRAMKRFFSNPRLIPCEDEDMVSRFIPTIWSWKTSVCWTGSLVIAFMSLKKIMQRIRTIEGCFSTLQAEMGFLTFDERQEMYGKDNVWAPTDLDIPVPREEAKGATPEQVYDKIRRAIWRVIGPNGDEYSRCHALLIRTNVLLAPLHCIKAARRKGGEIEIRQETKQGSFMKRTINVGPARCVDLEHRDLCVISFPGLGTRADLTHFLSYTMLTGNGQVQGFWVRHDQDFEYFERVPISVKFDKGFHYSGYSGLMEGYSYVASTWTGLCGSPIVIMTKKGCILAGLHVAGSGTVGKATPLLLNELDNALTKLGDTCMMAIKGVSPAPMLQVPGFVKPVMSTIHKRNPVNFVPDSDGTVIRVFGDVGTDYTPRPRVEPNYFKHIAMKYFEVPPLVPRDTTNRDVWNQFLSNSTCPMPSVNPEHLNMAVHDYLDGLDMLIRHERTDSSSPLVLGRPYYLEEALNGVDGHPQRFSINAATSAGFPFNTSKKKLLEGEPGNWSLPPEIHRSLYEALDNLASADFSGCVYKVTPKDEGCLPEKREKPRLFQSGSLIGLLIQIMYLGPALDFMTNYPEFFEIAIGVNPHDLSWHNVVAAAFTRFEKGFEIDYSKYDQTQHPDIKSGVAKVLTTLAMRLGDYPPAMRGFLEHICYDFVCPLVNLKGTLVECPNLMPSGTFTTAHGNCIYNSIIMRMSVYSVTTDLKFRSHVSFRALGDDNGGSFSDALYKAGWNQQVFGEYAKSIGMKATNGGKQELNTPFIEPHKIIFLSRETVYHKGKGHCVGRLLLKSLYKPLAVTLPSTLDRLNQQVSVVRSIYYEILNYEVEAACEIFDKLKLYVADIGAAFPDDLVRPNLVEYVHLNRPDLGYNQADELRTESREDDGNNAQEQGELANFVVPADVATSTQLNDVAVAPIVEYGSLGSFLDREYEIFNGQFDPSFFHGDQLNPFFNLLNHDVLSSKLDNIALLRCDVKLRIVCSSTPNHSGSLLFSYLPMADLIEDSAEDDLGSFLHYVLKTSRQHGFVRLGQDDMELEMIIPFLYWHPYINPKDNAVLTNMGELSIVTASPIVHAMNATLPVYVTIYGKMVNYKLSGATAFRTQAEFPSERYSTKASVLANMAGKASTLFGSIYPPLAVPAAITRDVMDGIAGVARLFGHSKPISVGVGSVVPQATGALCATNVNIPAKSLALDIDQGVSLSGLAGGAETHDSISHDYLLSRKVLVGVWTVTQDMGPGTNIFKCGVTPAFAVRDRGSTVLTPMGIVASQYNLWCGTMHYEVVVSRCASFGGKFIVFHDPETEDGHRPETNKSIMFDVRDTASVHIEVGWTVDRMMLRTNGSGDRGWLYEPLVEGHTPTYTNGVLSMEVLSPAVGTGLVEPTMHVELFAWADEDTVFIDNVDYLTNYDFATQPFNVEPTINRPGRDLVGTIGSRIMPPENTGTTIRDGGRDKDPLKDGGGRDAPTGAPTLAPTGGGAPTSAPAPADPTLQPTSSYPPGTPQTVPPTETPTHETGPNDSAKPSFWPTFFPTKTPTSNVTPPTQPPILTATRGPQPTTAPAVGGTMVPVKQPTKQPTFQPTQPNLCDQISELVSSAWVIASDGGIGIDSGDEVLYTTGATFMRVPVIGLPGVPSLDTTFEFTGELKVDGVSHTTPYVFNPHVTGSTVQTINITGSTAIIHSVTLSMLKGTGWQYWDYDTMVANINPTSLGGYTKVTLQGVDGLTHDALKLQGGKQILVPVEYSSACAKLAMWYAPIGEGQMNVGHLTNCGSTGVNTVQSRGCLITGLKANQTSIWLGSGTNSIVCWLTGVYFTVPEFKVEAQTIPKPPSDLYVGVRPNTTEILSVCGGERMNSLRSLLQVASVANTYVPSEGVTEYSGRESLHFFAVSDVSLYSYLLRSHVGVRGGMLRHYYVAGEGPAKLVVYRAVASAGMPSRAILSRGYEFTDTRVNPALSIKIPYYSAAYFYLTRTQTQPDWSSFPEVGFELTNFGQGEVDLLSGFSIAEDFALIQFLGGPVLKDRSA